MEVIIDGVKYLPANVVQPTLEELKQYIFERKLKSNFVAFDKVPPEYVRDDDRGRPFDTAFDKRDCFDRGYCYAMEELKTWIENYKKQ